MRSARATGSGALWFVLSLGPIVLFWWIAATLGWVNVVLLPSPVQVAASGWHMLRDGTLVIDAAVSLLRVFEGFIVACLIAIPVAAAMGVSPVLQRLLDPIVEIMRPIPPIAILPIAILWFGIGETSKIFVVAYASFFPIVLNAIAGFRTVEEAHLRAARILGAQPLQVFWHVTVPSAFPSMVVGMRLGLGMAFLVLVAAELLAASSGLGFLIQDARAQFQTDRVLVGIVTIGVLGFLLNKAIVYTEGRIVRWR